MKRVLSVSILLLIALTAFARGGNESQVAAAPSGASVEDAVNAYFAEMPSHIYKIGQADFVDMVKAGEDITIVDIRRAADYEAGHVKGAVNLPWVGETDLVDGLASLPQDGSVFIYCYSGQTAGQAVALMNIAGVPARSVNLGWNFGISKVEGVDEITETTVNELPAATYEIDANLLAAYSAYYESNVAAVGTTFANNIVSEANAKAIFDAADPDVVFVSIRKAEHFAEGHIEGAINVPFGVGMEESFASLPADKKLIVYCYSGQTAGQTVAALRVLGYDAVSLKGGLGVGSNDPLGWVNQGYPVVASE